MDSKVCFLTSDCWLLFNIVLNVLQECESSLKHKTELIAKLESKSQAMTETLQKMDEKYVHFINGLSNI